MGREYEQLECGCLVSCDGGGGLIPCSYEDNPSCKSQEYFNMHYECKRCGECVICYCDCYDEDTDLDELARWYFECLDMVIGFKVKNSYDPFYEIDRTFTEAEEQLRKAVGMEG